MTNLLIETRNGLILKLPRRVISPGTVWSSFSESRPQKSEVSDRGSEWGILEGGGLIYLFPTSNLDPSMGRAMFVWPARILQCGVFLQGSPSASPRPLATGSRERGEWRMSHHPFKNQCQSFLRKTDQYFAVTMRCCADVRC